MENDIIAAVATGTGGAMAVIRVSGTGAVEAVDAIFRGLVALKDAPGGRFFYGEIVEFSDVKPVAKVLRHSEGERSEPVEPASETKCHSERPGAQQRRGAEESSVGSIIDDVIVSVFRAPHSYTGEDVVEISCHGSRYIQQKILQLLGAQGVKPAAAGEFTMRALLNGRMALSQAEAVADLIAAENRSAHRVASNQMRGGYASELGALREELVRVAALLELELDFGEEEVEFADRGHLRMLVDQLRSRLKRLAESFVVGNALKNGVSVAIVGQPNVGKSTLLNVLLGDDRAMVSDIAGTTRDTLEECVDINGTLFRFVDTAGVRHSDDRLEQMGIARTHTALSRADVVLLVVESGVRSEELGVRNEELGIRNEELGVLSLRGASVANDVAISDPREASLSSQIVALHESIDLRPEQKVCVVVNKIDALRHEESQPTQQRHSDPERSEGEESRIAQCVIQSASDSERVESASKASLSPIIPISVSEDTPLIPISALRGDGLDELRAWLTSTVGEGASDDIIVSNARHHDALTHAAAALDRVAQGLGSPVDPSTHAAADGLDSPAYALPLDLVAQDLRESLHYLGLLTGAITTPELLQTIFSKFCIGK